MDERVNCSSRSRNEGEPLFGTASRFRFWLMVEQPGPWGHDALVQSDLPTDVGIRLRTWGREHRVRVLLIKRRERDRSGVRRCFVAFTGERERRLATFGIEDPNELLSLDLRSVAGGRVAEVGEPVPEPLYLVCTHGKHDACCATHGAPLFRALERFGGSAVWEATHVGGDRFAGNLVCFPHGVYYGRVGPGDAERVVSAYAEGRLDLDLYRGRSCYPPPVQAAEYFLRRHLGLTGVDDVVFRSRLRVAGRRGVFAFDTTGGTSYEVELEVAALTPRLLTCKATHPHRPRGFLLRGIA